MLTVNKVVLVCDSEQLARIRLEAIEPITDIEQVEEVWGNNKTPIISKTIFERESKRGKEYNVLWVPEGLDECGIIELCHSNGIESGESVKEQMFDTRKDKCFLCRIGQHKETMEEFNIVTPKFSDIIIYESENFNIKVELGCLIPGLLMINPRQHYYSMANLPNELFEEYYEVMKDSEVILKGVYGESLPVIFFEHGSSPTGFSTHASSIVHAHVHVAIGCQFEKKYLDMVKLKPITDLKVLRDKKYLSYQCGTDGQLFAVWDPKVYVQRQYPRQVIAEIKSIPNRLSNWREEPFFENIKSTINLIWKYLNENEDIPDRIRNRTQGFHRSIPFRKKWDCK